ncbi:zinc finger and BTB domain-containing protein 42-like isoform X1 [Saccostrea cucullata]|uniref:zinc finger and BTB domain-containing protein 42-like isoform X1 n=1 Tax=Saccostrea cuccullata TaxID=36930 RepID=UPI002ED31AAA
MDSAPLSMVYRSEKQLPKLNVAFQEFYKHEEFCDITLVTNTKRLRAHRVVLAAFSPYFYQAFSQQNNYLSDFNCHRLDEGSLKGLLDFCYSGVITVDSVSAEKLLSVATVLQIKEVEKLCQTFLRAHQAFVCEIASEIQEKTTSPSPKERSSSELFFVESSGRFSPGTSPNVSTSGRPVSETSSVETPDLEIVKQEHPEPVAREEHAREELVSPGTLAKRMQYLPNPGLNIIDMTQLSPTYLGHPYPRPLLFPRPSPQPFHLFAPKPREKSKSESSVCNEIDQNREEEHHGQSSILSVDTSFSQKPAESVGLSQSSLGEQHSPSEIDTPGLYHACSICQQKFNSSKALGIHMVLHDRGHPSFIPKRNRKSTFPQKHEHTSGEFGSTSGELFTCSTCGKSFKDNRSLKFHRYNHILRHVCPICGKRFSRSWNLQRHKKSHFKVGMSGWQLTSENSEDLTRSEEEGEVLNSSFTDEEIQMSGSHGADEPVDLTETGKSERSDNGPP